jgi:hypothetical protein
VQLKITSLASAWLFAGLILGLPSCGLSQSQISGVVKEAGTGHPIPGAMVAVKWNYYLWHTACLHLQTTTTDEEGRFRIPVQTEVLFSGRPNVEVGTVVAYKEGYRDIFSAGFLVELGNDHVIYKGPPDRKLTSATLESLGLTTGRKINNYGNSLPNVTRSPLPSWWNRGEHDQFMVPDISAPDARLEYLQRHFSWMNCPGGGSRNNKVVSFFEKIYAEANQIGMAPQYRAAVKKICRSLADVAVENEGNLPYPEHEKLALAYLRDQHPECVKQ